MSPKRTMRVITVEMSLTNRIINRVQDATRDVISEDELCHFRPTDAELIHFYNALRDFYDGEEGLEELYDTLVDGGTYQTIVETLCETLGRENAFLKEVNAMSHRYGNFIPSFFADIYRLCNLEDDGRLTTYQEFAVEFLIEKCAEHIAHFILERCEADIAEQEEIAKLNEAIDAEEEIRCSPSEHIGR